jgi:uncharacterized membrane protein
MSLSAKFSNLHAAIRYAELGYEVLPVVAGAKNPLTEHGVRDATFDTKTIESWWTRWPNANVGISAAGLVIIDIDSKGDARWPEDEERACELVESARAISVTPSGGRHFFFRRPDGVAWRCSVRKLAANVDVRTDGGYVVVPPSKLLAGAYVWLKELDTAKEFLSTPPKWLCDLLDEREREYTSRINKSAQLDETRVIEEGTRNDVLFRIGAKLRSIGFDFEEIYSALSVVNRRRCRPQLDDIEVRRIAESASRYDANAIETALVECRYAQIVEKEEVEDDVIEFAKPSEEFVERAPGVLASISRYILDTAYRPQPMLSLGSALSFASVLCGAHCVVDEYGTTTNLYCVGVGPSGCGKERTRQAIRDIARACGVLDLVGPEDIASGSGLLRALERNRAQLFQLDEFGRFLSTTHNAYSSPHLYNVTTLLLKLYTSANVVFTGVAYADVDKTRVIDRPHVALWGTTVPEDFFRSISRSSIKSGLLSRILFFESRDRTTHQRPADRTVPREIVDFVRSLGNAVVTYSRPAGAIFDSYLEKFEEYVLRVREPYSSLWARAYELARKLSIIGAVAEGNVVVRDSVAQWACELAEAIVGRTITVVAQKLAESAFEAKRNEIFEFIRERGTITKTDLCSRFRGIRPSERDEILRSLVEEEEIEVEVGSGIATRGRPKTVVRYVGRRRA